MQKTRKIMNATITVEEKRNTESGDYDVIKAIKGIATIPASKITNVIITNFSIQIYLKDGSCLYIRVNDDIWTASHNS